MNEIARKLGFALLLTSAAVAPARADATADLQTKLDAALKSASSFVVTTRYPAQAYSATLVFVAPDRTRVAVAVAASTTDVVTIGHTIYSSKNGAPFEKSAIAADAQPRDTPVGSVKVGELRPDVTLHGRTYGSFETTVELGKVLTLTCTYDKLRFRLIRCANDDVSQTYTNFDDPANSIEAPRDAIDAPATPTPKGGR